MLGKPLVNTAEQHIRYVMSVLCQKTVKNTVSVFLFVCFKFRLMDTVLLAGCLVGLAMRSCQFVKAYEAGEQERK